MRRKRLTDGYHAAARKAPALCRPSYKYAPIKTPM